LNNGANGVDLMMEGIQLGASNLSYVQSFIDNCQVPVVILYFYSTYGIKLGLTFNQKAIEWALDAIPELSNGLPESTGESGLYCTYQGYLLYVYYWANYYQYDQAKWNLTQGYTSFKAATYDKSFTGALYVYADNSSSGFARYYDEWGETARDFSIFYSFGITEALGLAEAAWNFWDGVDWNIGGINSHGGYDWTATEGYYQYRPGWNDFECEAGFFYQDVLKLQYASDSALPDEAYLLQDIETRFLSNGWTSPQWMYAGSPVVDHTVVHAYASNNQNRLANTLGAWEAIYGEWSNFTASDKAVVTSMLLGNGSANYVYPAWEYLYQSSLYDPVDNSFRMLSTDSDGGNVGNGDAALLMLIQGFVPQTATLAVPLSEYRYEGCGSMIDPQLLSMNFGSNQLTAGIATPGNVTFIFGTTPFNYTFSHIGLYTLQFTSDWNGITSYTATTLPSRNYFIQAINAENPPIPLPTPTPSAYSTPIQTPTSPPRILIPTPTPSAYSTSIQAPTSPSPTPAQTPVPTESPPLENQQSSSYIYLVVAIAVIVALGFEYVIYFNRNKILRKHKPILH
jgi:hypothetical protein